MGFLEMRAEEVRVSSHVRSAAPAHSRAFPILCPSKPTGKGQNCHNRCRRSSRKSQGTRAPIVCSASENDHTCPIRSGGMRYTSASNSPPGGAILHKAGLILLFRALCSAWIWSAYPIPLRRSRLSLPEPYAPSRLYPLSGCHQPKGCIQNPTIRPQPSRSSGILPALT